MSRIVTIGRMYGSGGHIIAERLAKKLNYSIYDKELLGEAAKRTGLDLSYLEKVDEKPSSLLFNLSTGGILSANTGFNSLSMQDQVFIHLGNLIQDIASKESCVIVGRAADYILRDSKPLSIFIHAPLEDRIQRVAERRNISEEEAETLINKKDKQRASYYNHYAGKKWGNAQNYTICIDSSLLGIDGTVDLLLNCIR